MKEIKSLFKHFVYSLPSKNILMFHHVTINPAIKQSNCMLSTEDFKHICMKYKTIIRAHNELKPNKVLLTFDDGLLDLYTIAYPFLNENKIPFTAFIITDFLDKPGYITTEQLKEMADNPLVTIGSHGLSHEVFPAMSTEQKKRELIDSKLILERITNKPVLYFAYSHGRYDEETLKLVKKYKQAFSAGGRSYNFLTCRSKYTIPRMNMDDNNYISNMLFLDKYLLLR